MYLLVKPGGRYWRLDYSYAGNRKTLALGIYPEVSLAKARKRREKAREQLAEGVDPMAAKRKDEEAKAQALSMAGLNRDRDRTTAAARVGTLASMVLNALPIYPSAGGYVLRLHRDSLPLHGQLFGRIEHVTSGDGTDFISPDDLLDWLTGHAARECDRAQEKPGHHPIP